jgi:hypothetical protein
MSLDASDIDLIDAAEEVDIETSRRSGETARTVIWVVVDGGRVYVRSVRADAGAWYRRIRANPAAVLHVGGRAAAVRAVPVEDPAEIERVSQALRRKYARHASSLAMMLTPETLPTTLRLEPA